MVFEKISHMEIFFEKSSFLTTLTFMY